MKGSVVASLRTLSLFSGGGGLDLGVELAVGRCETVAYVEREAFAASSLLSRMEEGALAAAPVWTDVTTFDARAFRGLVDLVLGGSPCQDLSAAGTGRGLDGERSGLFFEFVRIVDECRPLFFFWENVGGAESSLPRVFDSFEALGYVGAAVALRASDVGASQERRRFFLLGYASGEFAQLRRVADLVRREESKARGEWHEAARGEPWPTGETLADGAQSRDGRLPGERRQGGTDADGGGEELAHAVGVGGHEGANGVRPRQPTTRRAGALVGDASDARPQGNSVERNAGEVTASRGRPFQWPPAYEGDDERWRATLAERPDLAPAQPRIRGVVDGLARGLAATWADELRILGNGVVPQQAAAAFRFLVARMEG